VSAGKVDVLAVMERSAERLEDRGDAHGSAREMEARAAVAELIEAAEAVRTQDGDTYGTRVLVGKLRAALARVRP
jgi:hypothetical protein